jgi:UDP-N-acetylglucosamine 2-epimerase (non-hydrolysing)/GDP/UDP-N,N'-diacetylbacillosamine 2-epimerase (hydrolysing)
METPSLALPTVNVGMRQAGRERAANIVDAEPSTESILAAVERAGAPGFREAAREASNPYGDGRAAERIADVLTEVTLGEELLHKRPVEPGVAGRA